MEIGDIIITWSFDSIDVDYISIDKVIDIIDNLIYTNYYCYTIGNSEYGWYSNNEVPIHAHIVDIENFNISMIKGYEKQFKKLLKGFFQKYKIEGRNYKLNKIKCL